MREGVNEMKSLGSEKSKGVFLQPVQGRGVGNVNDKTDLTIRWSIDVPVKGLREIQKVVLVE